MCIELPHEIIQKILLFREAHPLAKIMKDFWYKLLPILVAIKEEYLDHKDDLLYYHNIRFYSRKIALPCRKKYHLLIKIINLIFMDVNGRYLVKTSNNKWPTLDFIEFIDFIGEDIITRQVCVDDLLTIFDIKQTCKCKSIT